MCTRSSLMTANSGPPPVERFVIRGVRLKQINYTITSLVNDTTKTHIHPIYSGIGTEW